MERMNLLVSDLDGTLLGDDRALDDFVMWSEQAKRHWRIVYNSGRFLDSIHKSIEEFHLPEPDAVICGVGTEIHDYTIGKRIVGWPIASHNWSPQLIRSVCAEFSELQEQPGHLLSEFKVSYYGCDLDGPFLSQLLRQLDKLGQEVNIVYSSNRDLDILPAATNKGTAATFLVQHWGMERRLVIVAGDSGNDLEMFQSGFRGIVVGNAQPELLRLRDPNVYHAKAHHAAGVLEGLQHWLDDFWPADVIENAISVRSIPDRDASRGTRG